MDKTYDIAKQFCELCDLTKASIRPFVILDDRRHGLHTIHARKDDPEYLYPVVRYASHVLRVNQATVVLAQGEATFARLTAEKGQLVSFEDMQVETKCLLLIHFSHERDPTVTLLPYRTMDRLTIWGPPLPEGFVVGDRWANHLKECWANDNGAYESVAGSWDDLFSRLQTGYDLDLTKRSLC